jgi:hypothetical protein
MTRERKLCGEVVLSERVLLHMGSDTPAGLAPTFQSKQENRITQL